MPRPDRLVLVAGTGTEVGKTWVACRLASALVSRSVRVAARKPAQSFAPASGPTDADRLGTATGDDPQVVCPKARWYEVPLAPPMAAEALDRPPPRLADLVDGLVWPPGVALGLVETAGGVRSPLAVDGDTVDLADRLRPDAVIVVAHAGLGTINDVRLAVGALDRWPVSVVLNRFDGDDDLHVRNREWLADRDEFDVVVDVGVMAEQYPTWCRPRG